jgi:hypothetical protein
MRYQTKKVVREIEVIEVTKQEYDRINDFYKEGLLNDDVPYPVVKGCNLNKMILTNGVYRKEFAIEINDNVVVDREKDAKERREYLEQLDKEQTPVEKEYSKMMELDVTNPLDKVK